MVTLRNIDVVSAAKMTAVLEAIIGFVVGIIAFAATAAFSGLFGSTYTKYVLFGAGLFSIILIPIVFLIIGFIFAAIFAWLYNVLARRIGGIKVNLSRGRLNSIDPMSAGKIYGLGGVIAGFVIGIIAAIASLFAGHIWEVALIVIMPIVVGAVAFIIGAVFSAIYNCLSSRMGGVIIRFKGRELRRIDPYTYARIEGIFGAIIGFVDGIIFFVSASVHHSTTTIPWLIRTIGAFSIIAYPVLYFIMTFLVALFGAWLYNRLAPRIKGIVLTLK